MATNKDKVLGVLEYANHRPMKTKTICAICNVTPRALQHAVRDLRLEHIKVCSGDDGYWIWNGEDDTWEHTLRQIKSRIKKLSDMYSAMQGTQLNGQQEMLLEKEDRWREALKNL